MTMKISELASQAGVNTPTIRYYEDVGVLPLPKRSDNGYRTYDESDLERVRFVARSRSLDFSLEAISEILALRDQGKAPCAYVFEQIDVKISEIDERIVELNRLRSELRELQQTAMTLPLAQIESESCVCQVIESEGVHHDAI